MVGFSPVPRRSERGRPALLLEYFRSVSPDDRYSITACRNPTCDVVVFLQRFRLFRRAVCPDAEPDKIRSDACPSIETSPRVLGPTTCRDVLELTGSQGVSFFEIVTSLCALSRCSQEPA